MRKVYLILITMMVLANKSWSGQNTLYSGKVIRDVEQITEYAENNQSYKDAINKSLYGRIARVYKLDPLLLYSISLIASSKTVNGGVMPWPYTLTINGKRIYYESEGEAKKVLRETLSGGEKNIAVGLMQVNLAYYRYGRPEMLLDPFFNIAEGARLLKDAIASTENYHEGIGRYFTWSDIESEKWGRKVLSQYKLLVY